MVIVPRVVFPSLNFTVPVAANGVTLAGKVSGTLTVDGFAEDVNVMPNETVKTGPVAVIPATVTVTAPVIAFGGTTATICELVQLLAVAGTPPTSTTLLLWVAPKPLPLMVTGVPTTPELGETLVIATTKETVNVIELLVTPVLLTVSGPLVEEGTVTSINASLQLCTPAVTPLNETTPF